MTARTIAAFETAWQFGRYGIAGGTSALAHLMVLSALVEFGGVNETVASTAGFLCAIPVNYLLQHWFVFSRRGRHGRFFGRYLVVTLAGLGLNSGLFLLGVNVFGFHYLPTQIVVIGLIFVANFFINREFTFAEASPAGRHMKGTGIGSGSGTH